MSQWFFQIGWKNLSSNISRLKIGSPSFRIPLSQPPVLFLVLTSWYILNCERYTSREPSWYCFSFRCMSWILVSRLGFSRVNLVRGALIRNSSTAVWMLCCVYPLWIRMAETWCCSGIRGLAFVSIFLYVWTFLVAN